MVQSDQLIKSVYKPLESNYIYRHGRGQRNGMQLSIHHHLVTSSNELFSFDLSDIIFGSISYIPNFTLHNYNTNKNDY